MCNKVGRSEQKIWHEETYHGLVDSIEHVQPLRIRIWVSSKVEFTLVHLPELYLRPFLTLDTSSVKLWNGERDFVADVLVQNPHENDRKRCKGKIEQQDVGVVHQVRAIKVVVDLIPEKGKSPDHILKKSAS